MIKCGLKYEGTRIKADRNKSGICDVAMYGISYIEDSIKLAFI
jgi:ribosomal-protein-alanine N-acetyltransferase